MQVELDMQKVYDQIDLERQSIIDTLRSLLQFESINSERVSNMPFGKDVHEAFSFIIGLARKYDFRTTNIDNYGGHIEFGRGDEVVGILTHLDVVPAMGQWEFPPFDGEINNNRIYGRGTIDNKGPLVASFFAMKILKDIGYIPNKKVRLIVGLDEETNWIGMNYYLNHVGPVDVGFTPDGSFPVINMEKGILVLEMAKKFGKLGVEGLELRSFKGGQATNMVADMARVVVFSKNKKLYEDIRERVKEAKANGINIKAKGLGKSLEIVTRGVSAHGAEPHLGLNAISDMFEFLEDIEFSSEDVNEFLRFYNENIGKEIDGKSLGIDFEDEKSGKLTLNVGLVEMDNKSGSLTLDIRYPVTFNEENIYEGIRDVCLENDVGILKHSNREPICIDEDSELIQKLGAIYSKHTGDLKSKPISIGGGTYARTMKNVVAFGPLFPGKDDMCHQKDEYIDIDELIKITKIYADSIYELSV